MKTLPDLSAVSVVNDVLYPYFQSIESEIRVASEETRQTLFNSYREYLEKEAQKTTRISVRIQLRINIAALKNKLFPQGNPVPVRRLAKAPKAWEYDTLELDYEV